jgi:hypothetical protein
MWVEEADAIVPSSSNSFLSRIRQHARSRPLPIPAPDTADAWLAERRTRLARRLAEVERKAETDALEDVQLSLGQAADFAVEGGHAG